MLPFILLFTVVGSFLLISMTWRQCVHTVLVFVVFEGAVRKWVLPQANEVVYFAKDLVMLTAYVKYFLSSEFQEAPAVRRPILLFLLAICAVYCLLETCNWNLGSPIVGIVGARNYLFYIPLMFLMRSLFRSQEELFRFLRWYLPLSLPIFLLATKQHFSDAESAYNTYVWGGGEVPIGTIGNFIRATGTFSYLAGYCAYLLTIAALCIPLLIIELPSGWKWMVRFIVVADVAAMLLTGSRGPIVGFALFLAGYVLLNRVVIQLGLFVRLIPPALIGALAICVWFRPQLDNITERFETNRDLQGRIASNIFGPLDTMSYSGFFGNGVGATYQASGAVRALLDLPPGEPIDYFYEAEPERIMLEIGAVGFIFWYGLRLTIIVLLWKTFSQLRFPFFRELALTAFLFHLVNITGQLVFQITFLVYYWFFAGFIFLLPEMERLETARWSRTRVK